MFWKKIKREKQDDCPEMKTLQVQLKDAQAKLNEQHREITFLRNSLHECHDRSHIAEHRLNLCKQEKLRRCSSHPSLSSQYGNRKSARTICKRVNNKVIFC